MSAAGAFALTGLTFLALAAILAVAASESYGPRGQRRWRIASLLLATAVAFFLAAIWWEVLA